MRSHWLFHLSMLVLLALPVAACTTDSQDASRTESSERRIAHIVFVDHEIICPSIKKVINKTWNELQTSVASRDIKVTRIHKDRSGNLARKYTKLRPTGMLPALYLLTAHDELVDLLVGELTAEQITAALDRGTAADAGSASEHGNLSDPP